MKPQHTVEWLYRRADTHGKATALICGSEVWSFAELSADVERAAQHFMAEGVQSGTCVALLGANSAEFVVTLHALNRLGAVAVPLNLRLTPPELSLQLKDVQASAVLVDARGAALIAPIAEDAPRLLPMDAWRATPPTTLNAPTPPPSLDLQGPQLILFTSGTTGRPKGAIITYGNTWWNAVGSVLNMGLHEDDAWLICLPLFHIGGLSILMRSIIYGIPAVLHARFDAEKVNASIDAGEATIVSVVSRMLAEMLDARADRAFPPTLRCVLIGGGPVPPALLERCIAAKVPLLQTYGMTETASQMATLAPQDALRKAGSAGKALMGAEVRVDAPINQVGEILVRGPVVTPGYWGAPPGAHLDEAGWFHTQDLGYIDEDGYLYVVSRRSDLIISGGENVYPAEVERVLDSHPAIKEVAVVGRPDAAWGEVPVAFVVFDEKENAEPPSSDMLSAFCRDRLAKFKVPVTFHPIPRLPRNAGGKILRARLRAMAEEERA